MAIRCIETLTPGRALELIAARRLRRVAVPSARDVAVKFTPCFLHNP